MSYLIGVLYLAKTWLSLSFFKQQKQYGFLTRCDQNQFNNVQPLKKQLPSRGLTYPTKREKENHLQNAIFGGYVNSLEGNVACRVVWLTVPSKLTLTKVTFYIFISQKRDSHRQKSRTSSTIQQLRHLKFTPEIPTLEVFQRYLFHHSNSWQPLVPLLKVKLLVE